MVEDVGGDDDVGGTGVKPSFGVGGSYRTPYLKTKGVSCQGRLHLMCMGKDDMVI